MNTNLNISPQFLSDKATTGQALKLHDAEMNILKSGSMGMQRLAAMRAIDLQENFPNLSNEDAQKMGQGYVVLKMLGVNGCLTASTRQEVQRLKEDKG